MSEIQSSPTLPGGPWSAEESDAGTRLDRWLSQRLAPLSRHQIQLEIKRGAVKVNGLARPPSYKLRAGDRVEIKSGVGDLRFQRRPMAPSRIELAVAYEDEFLLVVDKPAGWVVHPAPGHAEETLANALLNHCGTAQENIGGEGRCGIVHRLDKLTSGLLVVAKTEESHQKLTAALAEREIQRRYLGLALGQFAKERLEIDLPIGRRPNDRKRMGVVRDGREAKTILQPLLEAHGVAFLLIRLHTGRTHQIRVHLQSIGHPILGDPVYGWTKKRCLAAISPELRPKLGQQWPERQMLHAAGLGFRHPAKGEWIARVSALPDDMSRTVRLIFGTTPTDPLDAVRQDLEFPK